MFNRSGISRQVSALALLSTFALLAACSSGATSSGGTGSTTSVATDSSSSTTPGDATTTSPATTDPTTTTPATLAPTTTVAPEPLVLRDDGLGPFDFGTSRPADVIPAITAQLGSPASNDLVLYEDASNFATYGYYESLAPPYYYDLVFPVGRSTCWTGSFCAEFGGSSEAELRFIGWRYSGPPHMMASAPNLTIGAEWEDFPSMMVYATCYTTGGGTHHGIVMELVVEGGWDWLVPDGLGGWVENLPPRDITRVSYLNAGDIPFHFGLDC